MLMHYISSFQVENTCRRFVSIGRCRQFSIGGIGGEENRGKEQEAEERAVEAFHIQENQALRLTRSSSPVYGQRPVRQ